MADNYLENQYEQYRARKAAWEKAKKSGKAQTLHKPTLPLKKGGKKVFVTGGAGGIGKAIVEAFCKLNYQVAFCDKNELEGQQTAQATGAQFYPVDLNSKEALELCLQNIFKEIHDDLGTPIPTTGNLTRWAEQGVLLLNATLTVRAHQANSHRGIGWEEFTDAAIRVLNEQDRPMVFMLWGRPAQMKRSMLNNPKHLILEAPHPSPLSA